MSHPSPSVSTLLCLALVACGPTLAPSGKTPGDTSSTTSSPTTSSPTTTSTPPSMADFVPHPAQLHRLTDRQYRHATRDLVGVRFEGELPVDYVLHGYANVGAGELTIGPLDLELYEAAAWDLVGTALPDDDSVDALLGCSYSSPCLDEALGPFLRRAWRRPATEEERVELLLLAEQLAPALGSRIAVQAVIAAVLQSPDFLFRVEEGTPDPADPAIRHLTDWELAAKLSFFLHDAPPDNELLDAAEAGELTGDGLADQAERLLAEPRAAEALTSWFGETLELQKIDTLDKDATLYPGFAAVKEDMRAELDDLFVGVALAGSGDLREVFTTEQSWASPELLSTVYDTTGSGSGPVDLPEEQDRGGVLGRAGLLAIGAHNTITSPTHRGKLVRTRLLCGSVPPPPAGIVTELSEADDEATLRERLEQHATDPACAGCHVMMDPIGYGFEHFDPIGRYRTTDNGQPVDATSDLDGLAFQGAAELADRIVTHEDFPRCMSSQMMRHALGHDELESEEAAIWEVTEAFVGDGHRVDALVRAIVTSPAFLTVSDPETIPCTDGETRPCETTCDVGLDTCVDGEWMGCSAPSPSLEACNGIDDDCDGEVDEDLFAACTLPTGAPGEEVCEAGTWSECLGEGEVCNGLDDDGDGDVDEDLEVAVTVLPSTDLTAAHGDCDPATDGWTGPCNAAVHRTCQASDCATSGYGPVAHGTDNTIVCLDDAEVVVVNTGFAELATHHPDCTEANTHGGSCNAAISRFCSSQGLTTGFGPLEHSGDFAAVACTPGATVLDGSYAELRLYDSLCDGATARWGTACASAIHEYCIDEGFLSGHGPLENSGDLAIIACLGAP